MWLYNFKETFFFSILTQSSSGCSFLSTSSNQIHTYLASSEVQRKEKVWKEPREWTALHSSVPYISGSVLCCLNLSCSCLGDSIFLNLSARSHLIVNPKYKHCSVCSTQCFNFLPFIYWLLGVVLCTSTSSMYSIFRSNNRKRRFIKHLYWVQGICEN